MEWVIVLCFNMGDNNRSMSGIMETVSSSGKFIVDFKSLAETLPIMYPKLR